MVEDPEFGVSPFAVKVEASVFLTVEIHAPFQKFPDLSGCVAHHFLHRPGV